MNILTTDKPKPHTLQTRTSELMRESQCTIKLVSKFNESYVFVKFGALSPSSELLTSSQFSGRQKLFRPE